MLKALGSPEGLLGRRGTICCILWVIPQAPFALCRWRGAERARVDSWLGGCKFGSVGIWEVSIGRGVGMA